jgi:hypothetical protein
MRVELRCEDPRRARDEAEDSIGMGACAAAGDLALEPGDVVEGLHAAGIGTRDRGEPARECPEPEEAGPALLRAL